MISIEELCELSERWRERQIKYENIAEKNINNEYANRKFTYKAVATRDCWKELLVLIEQQK